MLTQAIKQEARRLGFTLVGVTAPDPPAHLEVFQNWLAQGRQGEMAYLETARARQARADVRNLLPECRSILVLGIPYPSAPALANEQIETGIGKIAAYALGEDYHDILPDRLRTLIAFIEARVGHPIPNRCYTDTGPILERELAQRAGLGWIGKNTCLINPQHGSYFFLAEILMGIELESDAPFSADRCGSCTRCIEACPTNCILPDRTLDARRCISYLTIEIKGEIAPELRPLIGAWAFGCDVCQQVCPWNGRFAGHPGDPSFAPRPDVAPLALVPELSLTPQAFNQKFKRSPVRRAKRRGYLRNIAVALGNTFAEAGDLTAVEALEQILHSDPEPLARSHAAWALGRIDGETSLQALEKAAGEETDKVVLGEIHSALRINKS